MDDDGGRRRGGINIYSTVQSRVCLCEKTIEKWNGTDPHTALSAPTQSLHHTHARSLAQKISFFVTRSGLLARIALCLATLRLISRAVVRTGVFMPAPPSA